jgi:fructose-bisphosphate aldolase class II
MPLVSTADLVAQGRPIAAFNVITLEHAEAIALGAERAEAAALLQISQNAVRFHGGALRPLARACIEVAERSPARLGLHLDHVEDLDLLRRAADAGFSSVMFDAGALPYAENLAATKAAAEWAHGAGLWLEAELGYVGGKPDAPASAHAVGVRTDPDEAVAFVAATGVDALAVAVGSTHAMVDRTARLDRDLIARLAAVVPVPLVLHGSSGVPDEDLRAAVHAGIRKINVGTALNVAFTEAVRTGLTSSPDPRRYLAPARAAMADVVAYLLTLLGGTE